MVRGEAFLGMASANSTMVGASSIVAAHADWEDYLRYAKQPLIGDGVAMNSGVSADVAHVDRPRYWNSCCWQ